MTYTVLTRPQAFSALHCSEKKVLKNSLPVYQASKLKFIKLSKAKKKNEDTDEKIVRKGESI